MTTSPLRFADYDALTFDCYGTLIDWELGILQALQPLLARYGVTLSEDEALEHFGRWESEIEAGPHLVYREVLGRVLDAFGEQFGFQATADERAAFGASVLDWPAFPDSHDALQSLAQTHKLVIISNVDDDLFAGSAARLDAAFAEVITAQQVGSYKPNLQNFHVGIARVGALGVPQERILHVAQSLFHDIAPANSLGLPTVWVNRRHNRPGHGATPPQEATPTLEVPDMATLARLVREQTSAAEVSA